MADEKQVRANITPKLHGEMIRAARRLGIHIKDFIAQAIKAKLGEFDVHVECNKLRAANAKLSEEKHKLRKQLDTAQRGLQESTRQVSDLRDECDRLDREITSLKTECDAARSQRNTFKAKAEEKVSELEVCEGKIRMLLNRGLWDRVRNTLPWVETQSVD